ncbi:hypothetical protein C1Y35_32320, partial [Pseudomonas sp. GW456-L14]
RYVDLIMNPDTRRAFEVRAGVIASTRRFFEARGFMEVETPMLQPSPGAARRRFSQRPRRRLSSQPARRPRRSTADLPGTGGRSRTAPG